MTTHRHWLLVALVLAGCSSGGYGVDLTVTADASLSDAQVAAIATLALAVSGSESFSTQYSLSQPIGGRTVKLVYRPGVKSGTLSFALTAYDGNGTALGFGEVDGVALEAGGTVAAALDLKSGAPPPGDMGSTDMGQCLGVTACTGGDGCCPSTCNQTTDSDCMPSCGNGVVESGELCDDGNTANGDGCDPTCRYGDVVATISGVAGGPGYYDSSIGAAVRFSYINNPNTGSGASIGIAADNLNAYVADNAMIRKISLATGATTTVAGVLGDFRAVDGTGSSARFANILDLELASGILYILDGATVRALDPATKVVTTLALKTSGNAPVTLGFPVGLGSDGINLTLLDLNANTVTSVFPNVLAISATGVATLVNTSATTLGSVEDEGCYDLTINSGNYYLACADRIVKIAAGTPSVLVGTGTGCPESASTFCSTTSIANYSTLGTLAILDGMGDNGANVRSVTTAGVISNLAGSANTVGYLDSNTPSSALFDFTDSVGHVAANGNGQIIVSDDRNLAVRMVTSTAVTTLAGRPANTDVEGADGSTSRYRGNFVAAASDGTSLYVSESLVGVRKVSLSSGASSLFFDKAPRGISVLGGNVAMSFDDGTIRLVPTNGSIGTFAGSTVYAGTPGTLGPAKDNPVATAIMNPQAIANDGTSYYFVDANHTIRKIDVAAGMVSTFAGSANSTDVLDGTGTAAHFRGAIDLASDGSNLYTLDAPNAMGLGSVLRKIVIGSGAVTTIAGRAGAFTAADGVGDAGHFAGASHLASDGTAVFVSDPGLTWRGGMGIVGPDPTGGTIRELIIAAGALTTMAGSGGHYSSLDGTGSNAVFSAPGPIVFDKTTRALYVADSDEGVVQRIK